MDAVMTLLECAERGDLIGFDEKQQLTAEITVGSSEGSQDDSKVNKVAPQYLKNSLLYVEPSKFQPPGIFNSPALEEKGTKNEAEEWSFFFQALEEKGTKNEAEEWSTPGSSLPHSLTTTLKPGGFLTPGSSLPHSLTTTLKPGGFFPLNKAFEHLDVKKISTLVISAVKKGKA